MSRIFRKLKSHGGASMIIAMVFMLFCTFVGGSVLASATANGYRVKQLSQQQNYLNQRSAALLVADELMPAVTPGEEEKRVDEMSVEIFDDVVTREEVTIGNGGVIIPVPGSAVKTRDITVQIPSVIQNEPLQRVMAEMTVWRYLKDLLEKGESYNTVKIYYLRPDGTVDPADPGPKATTDFWYQYDLTKHDPMQGEVGMTVKKKKGAELTSFSAFYHMAGGARLYDFLVDFGTDSQLKVAVNAYSSEGEPITLTHLERVGSKDYRITTISRRPVISWQAPVIEKGGAA